MFFVFSYFPWMCQNTIWVKYNREWNKILRAGSQCLLAKLKRKAKRHSYPITSLSLFSLVASHWAQATPKGREVQPHLLKGGIKKNWRCFEIIIEVKYIRNADLECLNLSRVGKWNFTHSYICTLSLYLTVNGCAMNVTMSTLL